VLEAVLEPVVRDMGFELLLLEWVGAPGRRIMRVYLDHPEGVSLDDCARMGRILGNALDAAEVGDAAEGGPAPSDASEVRRGELRSPGVAALLAGAYTLEVSSPGIERPLARLSHFSRFCGKRVKLRTWEPVDSGSSQKTFHGTIVAAESDPDSPRDDRKGAVVIRDLDSDRTRRFEIEQIRRAKLVFEG
jgi:ribosome maturation factor RimP